MRSIVWFLLVFALEECLAFDIKEIATSGFKKVVSSYVDGKRALAQVEMYTIIVIVLSIVVVLQFLAIGYLVKKLMSHMKYAKTTPKAIAFSNSPYPAIQNYK